MFRSTRDSWQLFQRLTLTVFGLMLVFVLVCVHGFAQSTQGSVTGSVKDARGAVVPGAIVTLTNTAEGTFRNTKSNGVGDYLSLIHIFAGPDRA